MKKTFLMLLLFLCYGSVCAREQSRITFGDATFEDVLSALEMRNVKIYNVKLPVAGEESYKVSMVVEEYKDAELVNTHRIQLQPTYRKIRYQGATEFKTIAYDHITFIFDGSDIDRHLMSFICRGASSGIYPLKTYKKDLPPEEAAKADKYQLAVNYLTRPFVMPEFVTGEEMPVLLYGSMWRDEKFNIYRFCGSNELDAEMNDEIFKLSPHYFIVKLKFEPDPDYVLDLSDN